MIFELGYKMGPILRQLFRQAGFALRRVNANLERQLSRRRPLRFAHDAALSSSAIRE
jgi:hypothetical protein